MFSAIVTTFLIRALDDLGPDYQQQSALLLHQILNGRDPSLESASDPTIPFRASALAVAVNCLWFASLAASLGASFGAMICKEWLTEYHGGANPVVELIRACQRQIRYMAFQRWNVYALVALLPPLLHSSVILFFSGAVMYLWQMDGRVAIVYQVIGGLFVLTYFISTFLPFVTNAPFRPYSTLLFHRLSVIVGKGLIPIVDPLVHGCYLTLRYITSAILLPFAHVVLGGEKLRRWYTKSETTLPAEYKHLRVGWANAFDDSLEKIDTSQKVQEEAVLWLSQMPLDSSESRAVVSSLALISSSRPHRFPKPVTVFLNLTLESCFNEEPSKEQTNVETDCIIVLGHIKFQSVVDRNLDCDHNVGGISVTALVAFAAQQLTIDAFQAKSNTTHSEGVRVRLLTAAAWLSPVEEAEDVEWNGQKLKLQDRFQFTKKIRMMLEQYARSDKPVDNKIIINLIHGMHACIPRGDYGSASSIVSFLPMLCDNYDSPWSEDEAVLRALITYALDLLLLSTRWKPLVEREIEFEELASELVDTLMITNDNTDVVAFAFWLMYRVPYAFKSRKTLFSDIARIWTLANAAIPEDHHEQIRERMNYHAVDAFAAVAQLHAAASGELPKLTSYTALGLLKTGLGYEYSRDMATYVMAMILNLGTPNQASTFVDGIAVETLSEALFDVKSDLEKGAAEEEVVDSHIYSTLILSKFPTAELDVEKVKALIGEMDKAIGGSVVRDSGVARNSRAEDLDRVRWKAIYLSALLFAFVPEDERQELMEGFRAKVQALLRSGGLSLATDYERCIEPLAMDPLDLSTPTEKRGLGSPAEAWRPVYATFEAWIHDFPLFSLTGSITSVKMKQASTHPTLSSSLTPAK